MKRKISFYAKVMVTERTVTVTTRTIAFLFLVPVISRKWHLTDDSSANDEMFDKVQLALNIVGQLKNAYLHFTVLSVTSIFETSGSLKIAIMFGFLWKI